LTTPTSGAPSPTLLIGAPAGVGAVLAGAHTRAVPSDCVRNVEVAIATQQAPGFPFWLAASTSGRFCVPTASAAAPLGQAAPFGTLYGLQKVILFGCIDYYFRYPSSLTSAAPASDSFPSPEPLVFGLFDVPATLLLRLPSFPCCSMTRNITF